MKVKDYKELRIWEQGIDIVDKIYILTKKFPEDEKYGLVAQMRRAAVSIPSNIAEGFMRANTKEFKQFLYISLGSCAELESQLIISSKRKYLSDQESMNCYESLNSEMRMIRGLINKLVGLLGTSHKPRVT